MTSGLSVLSQEGASLMTKPTKHKVGRFLLLSLIPTGIFLVISLLIGVAMSSGEEPPVNFAAALMLLWILLALPTGVVLLIWGNIEFGRAYKATRQYAERHGWLLISRTSWRNRKASRPSLPETDLSAQDGRRRRDNHRRRV